MRGQYPGQSSLTCLLGHLLASTDSLIFRPVLGCMKGTNPRFIGVSSTTRRDLAVGALLKKRKIIFALKIFKPRKSLAAQAKIGRKSMLDCRQHHCQQKRTRIRSATLEMLCRFPTEQKVRLFLSSRFIQFE